MSWVSKHKKILCGFLHRRFVALRLQVDIPDNEETNKAASSMQTQWKMKQAQKEVADVKVAAAPREATTAAVVSSTPLPGAATALPGAAATATQSEVKA